MALVILYSDRQGLSLRLCEDTREEIQSSRTDWDSLGIGECQAYEPRSYALSLQAQGIQVERGTFRGVRRPCKLCLYLFVTQAPVIEFQRMYVAGKRILVTWACSQGNGT